MAGIGAAIGEFTRGYASGLKLSSDLDDAQKKRDLYQAEIDTRNAALEKSKKIDAAREELANATKNFFPMPDGTDPVATKVGIQDPAKTEKVAADSAMNYRNAMFKYLSIASPEKLDDFRRNSKSEDLQLAALDAARVTAGLMTQDPRALEKAAQMNGILGPGETLDLKRSAFEKDKSVRFAINGADGKPLPDQVMSRDQIHFMGYRFLNDPNAMMQHASTFANNRENQILQRDQLTQLTKDQDERRAEQARHNRVSEGISAASVRAQGEGAAEAREARLQAQKDGLMERRLTGLQQTYSGLYKDVESNQELTLNPKQKAERLTMLQQTSGYAKMALMATSDMGGTVDYSALQDPAAMSRYMRGEGVAQLVKKTRGKDGQIIDGPPVPGFGITETGMIVPYRPKAKP
jgi:hypothetical protein